MARLRSRLYVLLLASAVALVAVAANLPTPRGNGVGVQSGTVSAGWTNVTSAGSPVPMAGAMMAYSPKADRFLLFGGWDGAKGLNGTWVFDPVNRSWIALHPALTPIPRGDEMLVYDSRSDLFVLFGGWYEFPNDTYMRLSDTWTFSLGMDTWIERHPGSAPSPRSDAAVAYDPVTDAVLLSGGFSGSSYLGDTWSYFPSNDTWWPRSAAVQPSARADGRMVYVPGQDRFILFGGNDYNGPNFSFHHLADTWVYEWDSNVWTMIPTVVAPPARDYPVFAVDPAADLALLTSGYGNRTIENDLWGFDLIRDAWSNLTASNSPPPRFAGAGGFDSQDSVFVLFSGAGTGGLLADTWLYVYAPGSTAGNANVLLAVLGTVVAAVGISTFLILRRMRQRRMQ